MAVALDVSRVLTPIEFTRAILKGPRSFVPQKNQVLFKLSPQPLMRADIISCTRLIASVLICDSIKSNFFKKILELLRRSLFFDAPNSLCKGIAASPTEDPQRSFILFIRSIDDQLTASGIVFLAHKIHSPLLASN